MAYARARNVSAQSRTLGCRDRAGHLSLAESGEGVRGRGSWSGRVARPLAWRWLWNGVLDGTTYLATGCGPPNPPPIGGGPGISNPKNSAQTRKTRNPEAEIPFRGFARTRDVLVHRGISVCLCVGVWNGIHLGVAVRRAASGGRDLAFSLPGSSMPACRQTRAAFSAFTLSVRSLMMPPWSWP